MEGLAEILRTITGEMQKSLSARTVVGEPISLDGKTVIPLVSVGMGFGAGTGSGQDREGQGGGGGGGLGLKPVAVIIADQQGVRVERLKATRQSLVEQIAEAVPRLAESMPKKAERRVEIEEQKE